MLCLVCVRRGSPGNSLSTSQGRDKVCIRSTLPRPYFVEFHWDYSEMSLAYRPSHADATYDFKYGVRSVQGGGRSSARVTIGRVAAGAIAKKILKLYSGTEILAYVSQVNKVVLPEGLIDNQTVTLEQIESNIIRCPNPEYAEEMVASIDAVRTRGDSDIGTPVFDKLEAELAKACMSLPATKGFEIGSGFAGTFMTGSEHNDEFFMDQHDQIRTKTNRSGGVQGGISNGEIINMSIAFKPTSTISKLELEGSKDYAGIFLYVYFRMISELGVGFESVILGITCII
ncbi:chorismate synthase 2, chloroplastic-like isoform X2 [Lycium barbarum]|uniref:chorismate synthase 2, chloroplastic-like isoform X2 n=1 Tax=Lycium barbarum TaxID=112863 RepID=UPI00293F37BF|nr:chorismate synthase 2, chloroplastic-like isoform X2 [Lycium barbarum]